MVLKLFEDLDWVICGGIESGSERESKGFQLICQHDTRLVTVGIKKFFGSTVNGILLSVRHRSRSLRGRSTSVLLRLQGFCFSRVVAASNF